VLKCLGDVLTRYVVHTFSVVLPAAFDVSKGIDVNKLSALSLFEELLRTLHVSAKRCLSMVIGKPLAEVVRIANRYASQVAVAANEAHQLVASHLPVDASTLGDVATRRNVVVDKRPQR